MLFDTVSDAQPVGNETGKLNVRVVAPLTLSIPHWKIIPVFESLNHPREPLDAVLTFWKVLLAIVLV